MDELRERDLQLVREQIGRDPTTPFRVVVRCAPDGHPLVIRNRPVDADGHPFPTLYWLTCPEAVKAISRLESTGAIADMNERAETEPPFREALEAAHAAYAQERSALVEGDPSDGGVAGTRTGVKCVHAHYANHLVGGDDPVGAWAATQIEPVHRPACADRVAVIDQGTNSIRLLIAEPLLDGTILDLGRDMVITRLGEGVDRSGVLAPEALERTRDVLGRYARRGRAMHALRFRMGATSAVRDASNGETLAAAVRQLLGVELEVLSGEQEAALSFLGAVRGLGEALGEPPFVVFDIGGGSTEFIVGDADGPLAGASISTQMGSVRLTERFLTPDPPTDIQVSDMRAEIDAVLADVEERVPQIRTASTLVGVAGTATTMTAIAMGLSRYDPDRIHGATLTREDAERVAAHLLGMSNAQRAALPVMAAGRGDVIVAGAEVLVATMRRFEFERMIVSEEDILDGLAVELLAAE